MGWTLRRNTRNADGRRHSHGWPSMRDNHVPGVTDEHHRPDWFFMECPWCGDVFRRWDWHRCEVQGRVVPWAEYVAMVGVSA